MRSLVRKRYAKLVKMVAIANGEVAAEDGEMKDEIVMARGEGFVDYAARGWREKALLDGMEVVHYRAEKYVPWLKEVLRLLATWRSVRESAIDLPPIAVHIRVKPSGLISSVSPEFVRDQFLPAVEGIDKNRIRICPVCDKLFVALRNDQPACSRKCGGAQRARQFRRRERRRMEQKPSKHHKTANEK